jgi:phosphotransferase system enzyme I (PtsI)
MPERLVLKGLSIVPGKGFGQAFFVDQRSYQTLQKDIEGPEIECQIALFDTVREQAREYYRNNITNINSDDIQFFDTSIIEIYVQIIDDPSFINEVEESVRSRKVNLETAIRSTVNNISNKLKASKSHYFKERSYDIIEVGEKLISLLQNREESTELFDPTVLVIPRALILSDILAYDQSLITGIVALNAGITSHVAILARAYNIPIVSGIKKIRKQIPPDAKILLDGYTGRVIVNPSFRDIKTLESEQNKKDFLESLRKKWQNNAYTTDGTPVYVYSNTALPDDVNRSIHYGADGIGLVRTEFLYFNQDHLPTKDDQVAYYRSLFEKAQGKRLNIRLLDIGGDKIPKYLQMPKEFNPFMGWRGIRVLLKKKSLFEEQLTAIFKAAGNNPFSIIAPMVSTVNEWKEAYQFIKTTAKKQKVPVPKCGVLFEVPLAIIEIHNFMPHIDFASIGTNDLLQYMFAADRNNPNVNYLHNPVDPAFLSILKNAISTARDYGKTISICGEMAGFPLYTILLLGLGLTRFSVTPHRIPVIKEIVSRLSFHESYVAVSHILNSLTTEEITSGLTVLNDKKLGSIYQEIKDMYMTGTQLGEI